MSGLKGSARDRIQKGIRPLRSPIMIWSGDDFIWAILKCHAVHDYGHLVGIPLQHLQADIYIRASSSSVVLIPRSFSISAALDQEKEIYIRNSRVLSITNSAQRRQAFLIRHLPKDVQIASTSYPTEAWKPEDKILQGTGQYQNGGPWHASIMLMLSASTDPSAIQSAVRMSLGCETDSASDMPKPWCCLDEEPSCWGSVDLWAFHIDASARRSRYEMDSGQLVGSKNQYPRLKIVIQAEKVLGQRMFIVDIEYAQKNVGLAVPGSAGQGDLNTTDLQSLALTTPTSPLRGASQKKIRWDELEVKDYKTDFRDQTTVSVGTA